MRTASKIALSFLRVSRRFGSFPLTSPPVGQALALDAAKRAIGAGRVRDAASVVAEIELADVALQVLGADVVIHAEDAALQDREVALDGVGMPEAAAHVFIDRMVDRAMPGELLPGGGVVWGASSVIK
jgi:hypothetical protein